MDLLITIDTEEDDAWSDRQAITTENVLHLAPFQELCDRFAFKPTWLTDEPMLADPRFAEVLGPAVAAGRAEIGAHLHPWSCRPFPEDALPDQSEKVYPHELTEGEFRAKLERIVGLVRATFGRPAVSYRAGRWGLVREHLPWLWEFGIRLDCSVTPHISWQRYRGRRGGVGGIDFRGAPRQPYWIDPADVRRPGRGLLLELPLTVSYLGGPFARPPLRALGDPLRYTPVGRIAQRLGWTAIPFRPWPGRDVGALLRFLDEAESAGLPYLMLMFHSSELMPAGSPYNPTRESVEQMYGQLETLFGALANRGVRGATLAEFGAPYLSGEQVALGEPASAQDRLAGDQRVPTPANC